MDYGHENAWKYVRTGILPYIPVLLKSLLLPWQATTQLGYIIRLINFTRN